METLLYLGKVGIIYSIMYIIYFLLFRKNTNFQASRIYLLGIVPLAFILPFINTNVIVASQYQITLPTFEVGNTMSQSTAFNWYDLSIYLYITVSGVLLLILFKNIASTLQTISRIKKGVNKEIQPFSFFSFIHVPKKIVGEDRDAIILHEKIHSTQIHSLDIIIYEISKVLLWWNPFLWMGLKSVKSNHEFIADKLASEKTDKYSSVLVAQLLGVNCSVLANNFNYEPLIKKRIMMMKTKKSNRLSVLKYALIIPVIAVAIVATANKTKKVNTVEQVVKRDGNKIYNKVDIMPEFKGGTDELMKYLGNNIKYPKEDLFKNSTEELVNGKKVPMLENSGLVLVNFVINKQGKVKDVKILKSVSAPLDNEAIRVIEGMPKWKPGKHKGKKVNVSFNLPIKFKLEE
jgi:bla regulator protein blaR1